jgi:hypothetical protein
VANFRIWAPWRLAYVKDASKDIEEECIFCAKPTQDDDEANLIVHRGERSFVILNLYPYTNGHLMRLTTRTATTSASTRAGSPARGSSTTSTCTSSPAGAAIPTSCR